jgi:catechol 2,3-dioxygenase-like lactoylglutathione lyase family enzyme
MIHQIAPVFFTIDIPATLAWYSEKLGFACVGTWQDPPSYAIVARNHCAIHFRCAEPPTANPDKYADELLDAYINVADTAVLHSEYAARGVEFARNLDRTPWGTEEFVLRDCDGRLLAFGSRNE